MIIQEMHYEFKKKLNKVDSQKYKNLLVPEIDWALNEGMKMLIKNIAEPRKVNDRGFEINQRSTNDIRTIVVNQSFMRGECIQATQFDNESYIVNLPENYWFYLSSKVIASKGTCLNVALRGLEKQHDDLHEESPFDRSSFEWRESNIRFFEDKIRVFTDSTYTVNSLCLNYIRKPLEMYNAVDFPGGSYKKVDGTVLTGLQSCELPEIVHNEIVDLAVQITTLELESPNYSLKKEKTNLND